MALAVDVERVAVGHEVGRVALVGNRHDRVGALGAVGAADLILVVAGVAPLIAIVIFLVVPEEFAGVELLGELERGLAGPVVGEEAGERVGVDEETGRRFGPA